VQNTFEWIRWAREQAREHRLKPSEAGLLRDLAARSNARGRSPRPVAVELIARDLRLSRRQVQRLLKVLIAKRLIRRISAARRPYEWELNELAPAPGQQALEFGSGAPVVARAGDVHVTSRCDAGVTTVATWASHTEPNQLLQQQDARAHTGPALALQPRLGDVLAVLRSAPALVVEDLAVNAALAAYPESSGYEHLRAAGHVASYALEDRTPLQAPVANRLLMTELRKQLAPARPQHGGARRPPWESARPIAAQTRTVGGETAEERAARQERQVQALERARGRGDRR